ncbi:quinone-dependent dihydroorotate dehydrogenase [Hyphomicrobium sp. 99]|uniref:quinone-dependent dihydroorotate dehydrogenase n=1 Tax=Hyphomicrobium sp. 99 TaxID=1163419 RepID=UPI0005F877AA|nr:quinone-dependent dihydroorotate dehydrogenase [Hyphomicrobium sp. 99]
MLKSIYRLTRPALFALSPEEAHELTVRALECGVYPRSTAADDRALSQSVFGLEFKNPIGIAAGYDKDARVPDAVLGMGCGFAEIGTVTPHPQSGNPKPRIFRLVEDNALINRLGFNNGGHEAALARLEARKDRGGIVGVNIGANKDSVDRGEDYVLGLLRFNSVASYFTVNISSPNTPGLRDLQAPAALEALLARVMAARTRLINDGAQKRPIVVKISPDIAADDIAPIVEKLMAYDVDAIAVSNTTLSRDGLKSSDSREAGGVSGRPLFQRSTAMLARIFKQTEGRIPLIGIGGIDSGPRALEKIEAGATLLQLYTGLIYEGPSLIGEIKSHLTKTLHEGRQTNLAAIRGRHADVWAKQPL